MAARRIAIAGGGIAALETLLALRAAPHGPELDITLIAPDEQLAYRPLSVLEPFGMAPVRRYALPAICADLGARLVPDTLARVDGEARAAVSGGGERVAYDALVIAIGARQRATLEHAHTFLADEDAESLQWILRELEDGTTRTIAFVVPAGNGWSLPLYELALLTARHARAFDVDDVALSIVTPEETPLAIFQGDGSAAVARLLGRAGIETMTSAYVERYDGRRLDLMPGHRAFAADRVVALPALDGPAIDGVPSDPDGFVRTDEYRRVPGLDGVYAIGDATTFPVKQGGIATQHADLAASLIARTAGPDPSTRPRLRAILFTGEDPLYLQATITGGESVASSASPHCPWWPPHKVAARYLAAYLADRPEVAAAGVSSPETTRAPGWEPS